MKRRLLMIVVAAILVVIAGGAGFLTFKKPAQRPASTEKVDPTPERVARGEYLALHALSCMHCHSPVEPTRWSVAADIDKRGSGGLCWDEDAGFPGKLCSSNITPDPETGIGAWTDGEIMRAIREGVSRDGGALFPIMDYPVYRQLPDEDVRAIVAYLRTMKPIHSPQPRRELKFPLSVIVKFLPKPLDGPVASIDRAADPVAYGKHLATVGSCKLCHTPVDEKHQLLTDRLFAGGQEFNFPKLKVKVVSANITPHATGLGQRTKENFVALFRAFGAKELWDTKIDPGRNTVMPWLTLAGMTDEDLGAIHDYLRTVPAIDNTVPKLAPR